MFPVHCCHSSLFVGSVFSQWFAMFRFRGDLPAVSHCRAMSRRYAPLCAGSGVPPHCPAMARYDIPGVRRYAPVYVGSGSPVWLVMVRFAGGRGCVASRRLLRSVEKLRVIWRIFSRGPGRRIPNRPGWYSRQKKLLQGIRFARLSLSASPSMSSAFTTSSRVSPALSACSH